MYSKLKVREMKSYSTAIFRCLLNIGTLQGEVLRSSLHLLVKLSFHAVLYHIQNCVNGLHWLVRRLIAFFEYACPHKDRIPFAFRLRIELICASDITFWGVP